MSAQPLSRQRDVETLATTLVQLFACSNESALRTAKRHWPSMDACVMELTRKQKPCVIALDVISRQREYLRNVSSAMIPIEKTGLPCFHPEEINKRCRGCSMLTWAELAKRIDKNVNMEIFFIDSQSGITPELHAYEAFYQERILREGFTDIVAFFTAVDGILPLVDYLHVRHFGGKLPPSLQIPRSLKESPSPHSLAVVKDTSEKYVTGVLPTSHGEKVPSSNSQRTRILFGNDPETSIINRQKKSTMQLALKEKGLAYIRGVEGSDTDSVKTQMRAAGITFPVIVKPVSGAGSEFVTYCRNETEVDVAFAVCKNVRTTQLTEASHMVLQEYIEGPEYVVNVVSYKGEHVISDIWRSWKFPVDLYSTRIRPVIEQEMQLKMTSSPDYRSPARMNTTALLYDRLEFVHDLAQLDEKCEVRRVAEYTLKCVDALGMRQGCSHCELRVDNRPDSTRRGSPVLIEMNPRMLGDAPRATDIVGYDQCSLMVFLALGAVAIPENEFGTDKESRSLLPWPPAPKLYRSVITNITRHVIFLRAESESYVNIPGTRGIKALSTFRYLSRDTIFDEPKKSGTLMFVPMTVDLLTSPGACVMEGTEEDIRRDTAYIRRVENKNLSEWEILVDEAMHLVMIAQEESANNKGVSCVDRMLNGKVSSNVQKRDAMRSKVEAAFHAIEEQPLFIPLRTIEKLKRIGCTHILHGPIERKKEGEK